MRPYVSILLLICGLALAASAQERPYFVTYDHHLEEPGNLEIAAASTVRVPREGQRAYIAPWVEIEYGVTGRWTTEIYLEGISTQDDSTISTGWRLENRFRPLKREHWINPVLYFEYESINEASGIAKEIVGNAEISDESNAELRRVHAHELETKLILSSTVHDWNISENFIVERIFPKRRALNSATHSAYIALSSPPRVTRADSAVRTSLPASKCTVDLAVQTASVSKTPLITSRRCSLGK
jgi:hypothetical protein